ncbi:MAG: hypothetical protein HZB92_00465 [Euryarchaeota archaeon]|nr:hypothetical protein [Euryarchaeota archaeon]
MKPDKDKTDEVKQCHAVVIGADDNPENIQNLNIPKGATGAQVKTQLGKPLDYVLRRQESGEVIQNSDEVYQKVKEGDKLLLNPLTRVGQAQ